MVRTKADRVPATYRKAVAATAPRKSLGSSAGNSASSSSSGQASTPSKNKYAGGNPVCVRPTPTWQKGIGDFFGGPGRIPEKENQKPSQHDDDEGREEAGDKEAAGGSGVSATAKKSRPLPAYDDEDE
nr:PCNA-associated factor-like [Nerophis lumbriciformis]